jgi:hypothetical protein
MFESQQKIALEAFDVKVKMMRHRITLTSVSKKLKVTQQAVSLALFGKSPKLLVRINDLVNRMISGK